MPLPSPTVLKRMLANITAWIMTVHVGDNRIVGVADHLDQSIFINGNLARVLLASYKLTGNDSHLAEGLRWCDTFVGLQHRGRTHDGSSDCGWWDTGYDTLYIADTGTAVTALALCHDLQPKRKYHDALTLFDAFVRGGVDKVPSCTPLLPNKTSCEYCEGCTDTAATYIIGPAGQPDAGALGDGYYKGALNVKPYTISTALTGGVMSAELYALAQGAEHRYLATASNAVDWLLSKLFANGTIPYIIDPPTSVPHEFQCITYTTEAFIDLHLRTGDAALARLRALNVTVDYILRKQAEGKSGALLPKGTQGEILRSARAASLLHWWYVAVDPTDERLPKALEAYLVTWLGSAAGATVEGLNSYALSTGFIGLTIADLVEPTAWASFAKWRPAAPVV